MSGRPARRFALLFLPIAMALLLIACNGGEARTDEPTDGAIVVPVATASSATTSIPTAQPTQPAPTQVAPTPVPPTPTPAPLSGVSFKPASMPQGGSAIVYLNEQATAATLTFQNRQYPMLHDGARWWAVIGIGAFAQPGLSSVSISYMRPGQTAPLSVVASITVVDHDFPVEYIELTPGTASLLAPETVQNEINLRASIFAGYTTQRLWSGAFLRPSPAMVTSVFGEGRSYNGSPVTDYHRGTDFGAFTGDAIRAAAAGRVVFAGELAVRGNSIYIDHGAGVFTGYHHLSQIDVREGDVVTPGQTVGLAGMTGLAPAPHLHWEVIVRGVEVDGQLWLAGQEIGP